MRCLIISDYATRAGGAHSVAIDSAMALAARGEEVVYLYGLGAVDPDLAVSGVKLVRGPLLRLNDRIAVLFGRNAGVTRFIRREWYGKIGRQDIVHVHGTSRYFGFGFLRELKRRGVSVVYSVHDYLPWCPVGTYYNHRTHKRCTLKPLSAGCLCTHCDRAGYPQKLVRLARHQASARFLRKPWINRWIFVSEVARRTALRLSQNKVDGPVVMNPVRALPSQLRRLGPSPRFVYLGRICPEKGISRLLEVARRLDAEFALIGDGSIAQPLPRNVTLSPHQDRNGIAESLAQAYTLVLLSEWNETFGLVVAEAASIGVASIVSKFCGVAAVLPADAGWVVDPFDLPSVLSAFLEASDPREALRRGAAAYKWFESCNPLSPQGHASALQDVYRKSQYSQP